MNAVLQPIEARFEPMTASWFEAVLRVEQSAYDHPWSRGNFSDSLNAGYEAQVLAAGPEGASELLGYFVAMKGVDEVHLLNITVAPDHQHQGWARVMLDALVLWSRGQGALWLWLEVRVSNERARAVYEHYGFRHVGTRRQYYPAAEGQREDAVVMSLGLS
ncbi:ribosomal protein S18-alanine N-acetyltransferase [Polaromonas eurypsychrophila]|uniref:[Ribosomal protein bS18]-alanine N-acetyltransferase n=1 Tax=Polaromonas eurypsychrophila TaxID=1614635 RepID=A0A916S870_9BURK|nr:ribosomal protein S18-alanine N-acetyltransferase [Polaromonas eurypsychrophila]GGA88915.1 ribosomal-protein-alanine acetyltransferase [Polaromonas eurypsychrophila]